MGDIIHAKLDSAGRLLVPAEVREVLGLKPGSSVALHVEKGELRIVSQREVLRRLHDLMRPLVPEGGSAVDEFIAERRAEAARDDQGT